MRKLPAAALLFASSALHAQQSTRATEQLHPLQAQFRVERSAAGTGSPVAGKMILGVGATRVIRMTPTGSAVVPIVVDPTNAGGANFASLSSAVTWDETRLTLDSVRTGAFGTLTPNTTNIANGVLTFGVVSVTGTTSAVTVALLYFTASKDWGGSTVVLAPSQVGNQAGQSILAESFARSAEVCTVPPGLWGDVNGDGSANIIDAQQLARASVLLSVARPELVRAQGDVTGDAMVDILDAQQVARSTVGLSAAVRIGTTAFVQPAVVGVNVEPGAPTLTVGEVLQATAVPVTAGDTAYTGCLPVTWSSSDTTVARVDSTGVIEGVFDGAATITAHAGGEEGSAAVTVGAGALTGVRLNITSPSTNSRFYALVTGGTLGTTLIQKLDVGFATLGMMDIALDTGTYQVRIVGIDSAAANPDSIPHVVAGKRFTGVVVTAGQRTIIAAALEPVSLSGTVSATVAAGDPLAVTALLDDPSGLFHGNATFINLYNSYSTFTLDRSVGAAQVRGMQVVNATQKTFTESPLRPTQVGTLYSQLGTGISVNGGQVIFFLFSPSLQSGGVARQTAVTPATTGFRVAITAPAGVGRFTVGVDTGAGPVAWATGTGTAMTADTIDVPVPAGTNYRIRVAGSDDFGFTPVTNAMGTTLRSGGTMLGQTATGGQFSVVSVALIAQSASLPIPTTGWVSSPIPFNGTMRDPSGFSAASPCLLRHSTLGVIGGPSGLGTFSSVACTSSNRQPDGTFTVVGAIPAPAVTPDTVHSMVFSSTIIFGSAAERIELVHSTFGETNILPAVTTGVRLNITTPLNTSRIFVHASATGHSSMHIFPTGYARSLMADIALPTGNTYTLRVLAADSLAAALTSAPLVNAGGRLTGIEPTAGVLAPMDLALAPIVVGLAAPSAGSVGAPVDATVTIEDPSYVFANVTWANVFVSTGPVTADRTGSSVQLTNLTVTGPTSRSFTGTVMSPLENGTYGLQAGFGIGLGFGLSFWAQTPSIQRGESLQPLVITTPPSMATLNVTVNAPAPANMFMVLVDQGPNTPTVLKTMGVASTASQVISVPIATAGTYRVRVASLDSSLVLSATRLSAELRAGAILTDVVIAAGSTVDVAANLVAASTAVTIPTTALTGQTIGYNGTAADPGRVQEGEICIGRWTDSGILYGTGGFGTVSQTCVVSARQANGTRTIAGTLPSRATPATRSSQIVMSRVYLLGNGHIIESNQFSPITSSDIQAQPATGIRVNITSPHGASRYYARVDGGTVPGGALFKLSTNFARTGTLLIPVGPGNDYIVRVIAADSLSTSPDVAPLIAAGKRVESLVVVDGAMTEVAVTLDPVTVDVVLPTTATEGVPFPIQVTLVDPSATIGAVANWAIAYSSWNPILTDRSSGSTLLDDHVQILSPISRRFSGGFGPARDGTLRSQFGFGLGLGSGVTAWIMSHSVQRGEAMIETVVSPSTSGIRVNVTAPTPTNRFIVSVDTGFASLPVVTELRLETPSTTGQVEVAVPPGTNFRLRVAAADSVFNSSATRTLAMLRSGTIVSGVTVVANSMTEVNAVLTAVTRDITVTSTATVNSPLTVSGSFVDPSLFTLENGLCGLRYNDAGSIPANGLGTLISTCELSNWQLATGTYDLNGTIPGRATPGTRWWLVLNNAIFMLPSGNSIELDNASAGSSTFTP